MTFTIPNRAAAPFSIQAEPDSGDFEVMARGIFTTGIISGCDVTEDSPQAMTIDVAGGVAVVAGVEVTVNAVSPAVGAAHATLDRIDLVVVDNLGVVSIVAGTASTRPVYPTIPANSAVLAAVYVPAAITIIINNKITDKRLLIRNTNLDNVPVRFGTGTKATISWDTTDVNAEQFKLDLPVGDASKVPVFTAGIGIRGVDLTFFNGLSQPHMAVVDADRDSGISWGFSADDKAVIRGWGAITEIAVDLATVASKLMVAGAASWPTPDSLVHIWSGTAGVVAAHANARLTIESNAVTALQFLSPNTQSGAIYFGDPESNVAGQLNYSHPSTRFEVVIEGTNRLFYSAGAFDFQEATTISTTAGNLTLNPASNIVISKTTLPNADNSLDIGNVTTRIHNIYGLALTLTSSGSQGRIIDGNSSGIRFGADLGLYFHIDSNFANPAIMAIAKGSTHRVAIGASGFPTPDTLLHIWTATAGVVTALAGTLLTIESSTAAYINFLTPNTIISGIIFGDIDDNDVGQLTYNHNTNALAVTINAVSNLSWTSGAVAFQLATTISTTSGNLILDPAGNILLSSPIGASITLAADDTYNLGVITARFNTMFARKLNLGTNGVENILVDGNGVGMRLGAGNGIHVHNDSGLTGSLLSVGGSAANVRPGSDNAVPLGTAALRWSDLRSVLINGADYVMGNKWRMVESEMFAGYPKGFAIAPNYWKDTVALWEHPEHTIGRKPLFVVTEEFLEYKGRRITPAMLDKILQLV